MARPLRVELAGALYHVTSRGDRREDIYLDDGDRLLWLDVLAQTCSRFNWVCHAWCQMTNHYHLVVETVEGNLSAGMRHLNGVYTQAVNRKHRRVGHVFQGRYKAILVEKDAYLLELARYVVLNPVRAHMVADAGDWRWGSYSAMVGAADPPAWLQTDWILGQFGDFRDVAVAGYVNFVRAGVGLPSIWQELRNQVFLGSETFVTAAQSGSCKRAIAEIPRAQRRPSGKDLTYYRNTIADLSAAMALAYASGDFTMDQIARHFGVHYSTVSRTIRRHATMGKSRSGSGA